MESQLEERVEKVHLYDKSLYASIIFLSQVIETLKLKPDDSSR